MWPQQGLLASTFCDPFSGSTDPLSWECTECGPYWSRERDCWDRLTFPGALDVARLATFIYP